MFSGFRSRWTMPLSCAAASPRAIWIAQCRSPCARAAAPCVEPVAQRLALEQLDDDEERRRRRDADVVDREDVRMRQRGDGLGFALESRAAARIARRQPPGSTLIATSRSSRCRGRDRPRPCRRRREARRSHRGRVVVPGARVMKEGAVRRQRPRRFIVTPPRSVRL